MQILYLEFAPVVDEQVLRLEVSVEDASAVAIGQPPQQLEQEDAHIVGVEHVIALVHVLLQVALQILKH